MEPVAASVTVPASRERAFELYKLEEIGIEPHEGGFAYERGPRGFSVHWGRIAAWDPPARLVLNWQIAGDHTPQPDPDRASEVEVRGAGAPRLGAARFAPVAAE